MELAFWIIVLAIIMMVCARFMDWVLAEYNKQYQEEFTKRILNEFEKKYPPAHDKKDLK